MSTSAASVMVSAANSLESKPRIEHPSFLADLAATITANQITNEEILTSLTNSLREQTEINIILQEENAEKETRNDKLMTQLANLYQENAELEISYGDILEELFKVRRQFNTSLEEKQSLLNSTNSLEQQLFDSERGFRMIGEILFNRSEENLALRTEINQLQQDVQDLMGLLNLSLRRCEGCRRIGLASQECIYC